MVSYSETSVDPKIQRGFTSLTIVCIHLKVFGVPRAIIGQRGRLRVLAGISKKLLLELCVPRGNSFR